MLNMLDPRRALGLGGLHGAGTARGSSSAAGTSSNDNTPPANTTSLLSRRNSGTGGTGGTGIGIGIGIGIGGPAPATTSSLIVAPGLAAATQSGVAAANAASLLQAVLPSAPVVIGSVGSTGSDATSTMTAPGSLTTSNVVGGAGTSAAQRPPKFPGSAKPAQAGGGAGLTSLGSGNAATGGFFALGGSGSGSGDGPHQHQPQRTKSELSEILALDAARQTALEEQPALVSGAGDQVDPATGIVRRRSRNSSAGASIEVLGASSTATAAPAAPAPPPPLSQPLSQGLTSSGSSVSLPSLLLNNGSSSSAAAGPAPSVAPPPPPTPPANRGAGKSSSASASTTKPVLSLGGAIKKAAGKKEARGSQYALLASLSSSSSSSSPASSAFAAYVAAAVASSTSGGAGATPACTQEIFHDLGLVFDTCLRLNSIPLEYREEMVSWWQHKAQKKVLRLLVEMGVVPGSGSSIGGGIGGGGGDDDGDDGSSTTAIGLSAHHHHHHHHHPHASASCSALVTPTPTAASSTGVPSASSNLFTSASASSGLRISSTGHHHQMAGSAIGIAVDTASVPSGTSAVSKEGLTPASNTSSKDSNDVNNNNDDDDADDAEDLFELSSGTSFSSSLAAMAGSDVHSHGGSSGAGGGYFLFDPAADAFEAEVAVLDPNVAASIQKTVASAHRGLRNLSLDPMSSLLHLGSLIAPGAIDAVDKPAKESAAQHPLAKIMQAIGGGAGGISGSRFNVIDRVLDVAEVAAEKVRNSTRKRRATTLATASGLSISGSVGATGAAGGSDHLSIDASLPPHSTTHAVGGYTPLAAGGDVTPSLRPSSFSTSRALFTTGGDAHNTSTVSTAASSLGAGNNISAASASSALASQSNEEAISPSSPLLHGGRADRISSRARAHTDTGAGSS